MTDYKELWIKVYVASIRRGQSTSVACTYADVAVDAYKARFYISGDWAPVKA